MACGSKIAKQDIIDSVNYIIKTNRNIDKTKILLLGGSGGGHMSLLMAAYEPKLWFAVSSWCPITNLEKWYFQNKNYAKHIKSCCSGIPGENSKIKKDYKYRSPISYLKELSKVKYLSINHGKWDPSVPFTHSYNLFNKIQKVYPKSNIYLNIFNGGHELYYSEAFNEFDKLIKGNKKYQLSK